MKLPERKPSGREKNEETIQQLAELREKLHGENSSVARRAAFNLSWMQEDGLEILEEALMMPNSAFRAKNAACYGLRNMHGRMRKMSIEVIDKGIESEDKNIRDACKKAKELIEQNPVRKPKKKKAQEKKYQIKEFRPRKRKKKKKKRISHLSTREMNHQPRRNFNR